ncbi:MAG: UDP-glucose 4-epimerase GalE [Micrococcus sp.]|nr:UDP-glucose 4-epimerase GalE [Micrococcus sp.]
MNILVTGGAGYIGSHTCLRLIEKGHQVSVLDNLCNSSHEPLRRVELMTNSQIPVFIGDVRDADTVASVLRDGQFDSIIHFAGLKSVSESFDKPTEYHDVNCIGTLTVARTAVQLGIKRLVFSSSATVYGNQDTMPIPENAPTAPTSPYGESKLAAERVLCGLQDECSSFSIANLRYFNPVGAHESGRLGEDPRGVPANLMPFLARVAAGVYRELLIYGNDYPTVDGTGVRDYIHVVDLADAHVAALSALQKRPRRITWNVGRGVGISVAQIVSAFERTTGINVPCRVAHRREGDIAESYADVTRITEESEWRPHKDLDSMVRDLWRWQSLNPHGYSGASTPT